MSIHGSRARLLALTKDLQGRWEMTRDSWNDAKAQEFESQYLDELLAGVNRSVSDLESLDRLLQQIHADCE
jgi:hypothetical protein